MTTGSAMLSLGRLVVDIHAELRQSSYLSKEHESDAVWHEGVKTASCQAVQPRPRRPARRKEPLVIGHRQREAGPVRESSLLRTFEGCLSGLWIEPLSQESGHMHRCGMGGLRRPRRPPAWFPRPLQSRRPCRIPLRHPVLWSDAGRPCLHDLLEGEASCGLGYPQRATEEHPLDCLDHRRGRHIVLAATAQLSRSLAYAILRVTVRRRLDRRRQAGLGAGGASLTGRLPRLQISYPHPAYAHGDRRHSKQRA